MQNLAVEIAARAASTPKPWAASITTSFLPMVKPQKIFTRTNPESLGPMYGSTWWKPISQEETQVKWTYGWSKAIKKSTFSTAKVIPDPTTTATSPTDTRPLETTGQTAAATAHQEETSTTSSLEPSASGWWTLEAYDTGSGTQHTVDYFKIHFKSLSNGRFETTASVNSNNQTIGDGVYIQNLTVDHNLAGDSFTLEAPNGTSYALYNLNDDQVYALDGAATTHFEGVNTNGTWRLKATSSNMTTDMQQEHFVVHPLLFWRLLKWQHVFIWKLQSRLCSAGLPQPIESQLHFKQRPLFLQSEWRSQPQCRPTESGKQGQQPLGTRCIGPLENGIEIG